MSSTTERRFTRFTPALGMFAGGLAHSLMPRGTFGAYDFAIRATIDGVVAGIIVYFFILALNKRQKG